MRIILALAVLLQLTAASGFAQNLNVTSKAGAKLAPLSRAELRACMAQDDEMGRLQDDIQLRQVALEADRARLMDGFSTLAAPGQPVQLGSQDLVERNNRLALDVERYNNSLESYRRSCMSRPFVRTDEAALLAERKAAKPQAGP